MKKILATFTLLLFLLASCSTPKYLPDMGNYWKGSHGAYIKVTKNDYSIVKGELIEAKNDNLRILTSKKDTTKLMNIEKKDIKRYWIKYAKSPQYGWTIPVYALSTISHGFFLVITLPVNLIATIAITSSSNKNSSFNQKHLAFSDLKMYARFPQGIPENIDPSQIK
ncbi:MAG TPA: hypothetical protein ENK91_08435 [Bacteroidetes bacterium]|nr:hypothetical protein [Bacteroidota bacterium]